LIFISNGLLLVMAKLNKPDENAVVEIWFNGMEIETARYAILGCLNNNETDNAAEADAMEKKFDHKIENFESYDGLKIGLTVKEIQSLIKLTSKETDRERKAINEYKKELSLSKGDDGEAIEKETEYSIRLVCLRELMRLNQKLGGVL